MHEVSVLQVPGTCVNPVGPMQSLHLHDQRLTTCMLRLLLGIPSCAERDGSGAPFGGAPLQNPKNLLAGSAVVVSSSVVRRSSSLGRRRRPRRRISRGGGSGGGSSVKSSTSSSLSSSDSRSSSTDSSAIFETRKELATKAVHFSRRLACGSDTAS